MIETEELSRRDDCYGNQGINKAPGRVQDHAAENGGSMDSEHLSRADEDAFNYPATTRKERWSYYLYYNGNNGVSIWSYSVALFQLVLTQDSWDPSRPIEKGNCQNGGCVVGFGSGSRSVTSIILIATCLPFVISAFLFLGLGSAGDYGNINNWLLLIFTVVTWISQFAMIAIRHSNQWPTAMVFFVLSYAAYGACQVFYFAIFPRLARFVPHVQKARDEDLKNGNISQQQYDEIESMERNHISSVSTAQSNLGYLVVQLLCLSILIPFRGRPFGNNLAICLANIYNIAVSIWWFIFQKPRPGPRPPKCSNYLTLGFKQIAEAFREIGHIPQTFFFLIALFLLSDSINTTIQLIYILQNEVFAFNFLKLTYVGILTATCSMISTYGFWVIQKYFKFKTKSMFLATNLFTILIPLYGMIGYWTTSIGFRHEQEFWILGALWGLFQAPYYAYAQTMMSELTPRGYENMFFALYGMTTRVSAIIGPIIVQSIINSTNNNWSAFPFLFSIALVAVIGMVLVNIEKGREHCLKFVEERKSIREAITNGGGPVDVGVVKTE